MRDVDEVYEQASANNARCRSEGHDWSHSTDARVCRRCGERSAYGSNPCHGGHDWTMGRGETWVCRRCPAELTLIDRQRLERERQR